MANSNVSSSSSGASPLGALSPEELDRLSALYVPTWELAPGAVPFPSSEGALDLDPVALESIPPPPDVAAPVQRRDPKKTQLGIMAPVFEPVASAGAPLGATAAPHTHDPMLSRPVAQAVPEFVPAKPFAAARRSVEHTPSVDSSDDLEALPRKRSMLPFAIGGGVLVVGIGLFFALRGGNAPPATDDKATVSEPKRPALPTPNAAPEPTATTTASTPRAAAPTAPTPLEKTTAVAPTVAKTVEPPPLKASVNAKAPPPAAPPTKATAVPKPPPAAGKKPPPKIKDEF